MNITAIHEIREDHLEKVMEEMKVMGAPTIRIAETCYGFVALEGTHRLEAAHRLGLTPEFVEMEEDEMMEHDFDTLCETESTVAEILDYIQIPEGKRYEF